jgi:hypothetical protein
MTKVVVEAGSCGFKVIIEVIKVSARGVKVSLASDCEMVNEMNRQLRELDWQNTLRAPQNSPLYNSALEHINHPACPVPLAILKAIEVEVGAAPPKDVTLHFVDSGHS